MRAYETLRVDRDELALTVTIDRPAKRNALSEVVLGELADLLVDHIPEDVRGVLLVGAGEQAFVAGADITRMAQMTPAEGATFGRLGQRVTELVEAVPVPVIACVDGVALGGGCELALACDLIFATERSTLGQPEVALGLIPGFGGCVRLGERVGPGCARELIFSGRHVGADEARAIGLVDRVFASRAELLAGAREQIARFSTRSASAIAACKRVLVALAGKTRAEQLALEAREFARVFDTPDKREGVAAFLAKRG